jgi:hypothetical protein
VWIQEVCHDGIDLDSCLIDIQHPLIMFVDFKPCDTTAITEILRGLFMWIQVMLYH